MPVSESPLRYPGGKTKCYDYVKNIISANNLLGETYVEPFAGGAGLALKLLLKDDVKRIVINDLDIAIYSFWYSALNYTQELCELIYKTEITKEEWERQRIIYNNQAGRSTLELGFATFFLNRTNVSGVIKGGMIGGKSQSGNYKIDARYNKYGLIEKIEKVAGRKEDIVLMNLDAKRLLNSEHMRHFYKTFINFDPPYVRKGAQLYKNSFTEKDHSELANLIGDCNRKWIVTYDICPLVVNLYKNYRSSYLDITYSIQGSRKAQEYIFYSNNLIIPDGISLIEKIDSEVG